VLALAGLIVMGCLSFGKFYGLDANLQNFWAAQTTTGLPLGGLELAITMGSAMVGAIFSCDAWNNITFASEEVKDAQNVLPRSLAIGTLLVVALYVLANVAYLLLLPLHGDASATTIVGRGIQFAAEDRVGTAAAEIIFGPAGRFLMAGAIIISTFGCVNGLILAGARVYYAMAQDGLFFKKAGILSSTTGVPVFGLVIQGVWTAILTTTGTYGNLLDYVVFAALLFYVLTVAALIVLRKKMPDAPRPYKVMFYPLMPALYLVAATAIMVGVITKSPQYAGFGLLIILSGLPVFFIWRRINSRQLESSG
jgi:APA family basic amino acid/polyamine antiporter